MNPIMLLAGGAVLLVALYFKGYLGFGEMLGIAAAGKPGSIMPKQSSREAFSKAVKLAMEEAHEEIAGKMADEMRAKVVQTHMAAFPGSGPSAQPAPESASPAAPSAS